ncbi:GNAT family N-acetyltransferase [Schleiferiaceae bacterium]|nr:GNAT family N-acetyltransferase [Schleiferiaceae bacterium]
MERAYKVLSQQVFEEGDYQLVPIRHEDQYDIMKWRNEQINLLRQKEVLTIKEQNQYFNTVVNNLFTVNRPNQLLFSFLKNNVLIGYGGLVHIDWDSLNGEISFLLDPKLMQPKTYSKLSDIYLPLIKEVANQANLKKVYTYGYDLDGARFLPLYRNGFELEAYLHEHVKVDGATIGVRIYSYLLC